MRSAINDKRAVCKSLLAFVLVLWMLAALEVSNAFAACSTGDNWMCTNPPTPTPPTPPAGGVITAITESVTNVFHHLVFPVQTISDALLEIFSTALGKEQHAVAGQEQQWIGAFSSLFQAPPAGAYANIANGGLKIAAGIAVALFILRLAIYNWNRMLGEDDDTIRVIGDWLTTGILALAAGPLLDLINRIGWWIMGVVLGDASALGKTFANGLINTSWTGALASTTFIGPIILIAIMVASMLAVIGILVAFASGHAVMYVLAAIGPTVMVAGVIPKIRWLRGMWFQATAVVALLPVVAAAVFKAGIEAAVHMEGGLAQEIFRILWLFGVTGFLLSLTGVLSKFTIGAAGDAFGRLVKVGRGIIESAVLAGGAIATGGTGAALGAVGTSGTLAAGQTAFNSASSAIGGFSAAQTHLENAQSALSNADTASGLGMNHLATGYQRQSMSEQIEARKIELDSRMAGQVDPLQRQDPTATSSSFGYSPTVNAALASHYPEASGMSIFNEGLMGLTSPISNGVLDPNITPNRLVESYTDDMMKMIDAWHAHPEFANSEEPLWSTMGAAGVSEDFKSLFKGS